MLIGKIICKIEKPLALQIGQEAAASLVMGVRNVVSALRALPRHLANLGHDA